MILIGVDEAGRGPLAGPVYAAAVIFDNHRPIAGLKDSKQLSPAQRESAALRIKEQSHAWGIGAAEVAEIDELNILRATFLSMSRAVRACLKNAALLDPSHPEDRALPQDCFQNLCVQVDGPHCPGDFSGPWSWPYQTEAIVQGDRLVAQISAASILAKVERDGQMRQLDRLYPQYGFGRHSGYGTAQHLKALEQYGPCPEHRKSFAPVRRVLKALS